MGLCKLSHIGAVLPANAFYGAWQTLPLSPVNSQSAFYAQLGLTDFGAFNSLSPDTPEPADSTAGAGIRQEGLICFSYTA